MVNSKISISMDRVITSVVWWMLCSVYVLPDNKVVFLGSQLIFILIIGVRCLKKGIPLTQYLIWCIIFIGWAFVTSVWAYKPIVVLRDVLSVIQVMTVGMFLVIFVDDEHKFNSILKAIIFGGLLLSIRLVVMTPINDWGTERLGEAIGYNPNTIGLSLSFSFISAIYLSRRLVVKYYYLLAIPLGLVALFSGSRKTFLIILFGSALTILLSSKKLKKNLYMIPVLLLFGWGLYDAVLTIPSLYNVLGYRIEKVMMIFSGDKIDASAQTRLYLLEEAWILFKERPFIGYGLANFAQISSFGLYTHNNYMELLSCTGLIGTIIYYSYPIKVLLYSIFKWKNGNHDYNILIVFLLCILILDLAMVSYSSELTQFLIAISVGYSLYLSKKHKSLKEQ